MKCLALSCVNPHRSPIVDDTWPNTHAMAISPLGSVTQSYTSPRPAPRAAPPSAARDGEDRVSLSPAARQLQVTTTLLRQPLEATEAQINQLLEDSYAQLLERAGRSDYLASVANPTDLSPEATAGRILGGITGYIYEAYKLQNPDLDAGGLAKFQTQVMRGFETGLGEAKSIIAAMGILDDKLGAEIGQTESLVREGLDAFFTRERERLSAPPDGTTATPAPRRR